MNGLLDVIKLVHKPDPPRIHNASKVSVEVECAFDDGSHLADKMHVQCNLIHNVGTLNLHGHLLLHLLFCAILAHNSRAAHRSLVHLSQTRGSNRLTGKTLKHILNTSSQLSLDNLPRLGGIKRRHLILQTLQSPHVRRTQQIGTNAQTLSDLDEARSQFRQEDAQFISTRQLIVVQFSRHKVHGDAREEGPAQKGHLDRASKDQSPLPIKVFPCRDGIVFVHWVRRIGGRFLTEAQDGVHDAVGDVGCDEEGDAGGKIGMDEFFEERSQLSLGGFPCLAKGGGGGEFVVHECFVGLYDGGDAIDDFGSGGQRGGKFSGVDAHDGGERGDNGGYIGDGQRGGGIGCGRRDGSCCSCCGCCGCFCCWRRNGGGLCGGLADDGTVIAEGCELIRERGVEISHVSRLLSGGYEGGSAGHGGEEGTCRCCSQCRRGVG
mmetsp:Transcript_27716/g.58565  ORF Transcript_27716/g.58565 Transcript_27716/m.58565 type:complete len:434 (+) Transcript_27716:1545-2846(+)